MLILFALVMTFGMFDMRLRNLRILTVYTICLIGVVILWRTSTMPQVYVAQLEIVYFVLTAVAGAHLAPVGAHFDHAFAPEKPQGRA